MARRRNAPALFELLRESNSTRTGQVGNEQMRAQIGAGSVNNSAPKPPNHPDVLAAKKAVTEAAAKAQNKPKPAQSGGESAGSRPDLATNAGSTDEVLEIKQDQKLHIERTSGAKGGGGAEGAGGVDEFLSIPSFKAGGASRPAPKAAKPLPSTEKVTPPKASAPKAKASVPTPKPDMPNAPKASDVQVPSAKPEVKKPEVKHQASSLEAEKAKDGAKSSVSVVEPKPEPAARKPSAGASGVAPAKSNGAPAMGGEARTGTSRVEFTPLKLGLFGAFGVLLVFAIFVVAYSIGKSDAREEIVPQLSEEAGNTLAGAEADRQQNEGTGAETERLVDPLAIARDDQFVTPSAGDAETGQSRPEAQGEGDPGTPAGATGGATPGEITNEDTRISGHNYKHLAAVADQEEARRLQIFLAENGLESYIRTNVSRSGRETYEPIILVGIPSEGYTTSTEKIAVDREIERLGGIWFNELGGSVDYSRPNQWVWYKAP